MPLRTRISANFSPEPFDYELLIFDVPGRRDPEAPRAKVEMWWAKDDFEYVVGSATPGQFVDETAQGRIEWTEHSWAKSGQVPFRVRLRCKLTGEKMVHSHVTDLRDGKPYPKSHTDTCGS